jgi:hypothetical protein
LRAAESGNQAQIDFRLTEFGIFGSIDKITGNGNFCAAAQSKAVYRRDDGNVQFLKFADNGVAFSGKVFSGKRVTGGQLINREALSSRH